MKNSKLATCMMAPIALIVMATTANAKDVEQGYFIQADAGQAKGYTKSADLRSEVLRFGDVGTVNPLSQKRRAWKVSTGYRFDNNFALALSYADLGVTELGTTTGNNALDKIEALSGGASALSAIFNIPFTESFNMHAKVGYAHLSARANRTPNGHGVNAGSNDDIVYGAGMSFDLTENTSLIFDWERYKFDRQTDLLTAGLRYTFGESAPLKATPAPTPVVAPEPVVTPEPIEAEPTPAPVVELKPLQVNVFFANDSSEITAEAKALLAQAQRELDMQRLTTINVQGSASVSGNAQYNQLLSMRRANAVADYIKSQWGVSPEQVHVSANGEDNAQSVDSASDRKVSVQVEFN